MVSSCNYEVEASGFCLRLRGRLVDSFRSMQILSSLQRFSTQSGSRRIYNYILSHIHYIVSLFVFSPSI